MLYFTLQHAYAPNADAAMFKPSKEEASVMKTFVAGAVLAVALSAHAQTSLTTPVGTYSQNFNSLSAAGATNAWANGTTLPGWSLNSFVLGAATNYRASTGADNTGSFYSYGLDSADRALGSQASNGTGTMSIVFGVTNASTVTFNSFTVGFDGEQWRNGGNVASQSMSFEYAFGATLATATGWTTPGGFVWASPVTGASGAAVNGNAAGLVTGLGGTRVTNWAPGQTLWMQWVDINNSGNDHGLAIDNFTLSVTAVPEPGTYALLLAGLGVVGVVARRRRG
jgi:PEP-CTERM motif